MPNRRITAGSWVVYRKPKQSPTPGPRAKAVSPAAHGDNYSYYVEKFWVVTDLLPDGRLRLRTRKGKSHVVSPGDLNLRPAHWWERWLYRSRFRDAEQTTLATGGPA